MTDSEFRAAFTGHQDAVYGFAYRMMAAEADAVANAEDVAQEVFLALWRRPGGFDAGRGELRAYLLGMARNLVWKRWRARRPAAELDEDALVSEAAATLAFDVEAFERREAVAAAVARLPVLQREALVLAEFEGMTAEEIARVTAADVAAVKSRLYRARQNMRRMLASVMEAPQPKGVMR